jgi:hypothetical protein
VYLISLACSSVLAGRTLLSLLVDLAEEGLVELELLSIHLALCLFALLLINLLLKELSILTIDLLDLLIQPFLFLLIVRLVARPNHCLLIVVVLSVALTAKLFLNLLR